MLLGNYTPLSANPGRCVTHAIPNPYKWRSSGNMYSFYTGDATVTGETSKSSFNNGYVPPYSWVLAPKAGGLSSCNEINGSGDLAITSLSLGGAIASSLSGSGTIQSTPLALITSMTATLLGSGALTASMVGSISMAATLAGSGDLVSSIKLIANVLANLSGTGALSGSLRSTATLEADIYVNQSQATTEQLVSAIWNAIATSYNQYGSMGEKLNLAGSGGVDYGALADAVWEEPTADHTTNDTFGRKVRGLRNPSIVLDGEVIG